MRRNLVFGVVAFASAAALSALAGSLPAQTGTATVRGIVMDSSTRLPVPNVQVSIGATRRVLTDEAGRFTIGALNGGTVTVRAQRIGFGPSERTVTLAAGQTADVNFTLRPAAAVLSSVVTVGYGTTSRAEVSNAVAQVAGTEILGAPSAGLDAALQGRAPGVQVVQNAGNPGNGITVRVRGASSISASNQPLYVIDGLPMIRENYSQFDFGGQDITAVTGLSPDEIETIDVLKDAAAAAIYGSRASNGVVMITTKRGRPGRTRFTFSSYVGRQDLNRRLELMNSKEYADYFDAAFANDGSTSMDELGVEVQDLAAQYDTDWQAAVTRDVPISDVSMQVQGGGDRFQYLLSGSRFDQPGIVVSSGYNRLNARLNLDFTATPKFTLRSSIGFAREDMTRIENDNTIEGTGANAMANPPLAPIRKDDGTYAGPDEWVTYANPVALGEFNTAPAKTHRMLGSLEAAYALSDRVRFTGRLGADVYDLDERRWDSPRVVGTYAAGAVGVGTQASNTATRYVAEAWTSVDPFRDDRQSLALTAGGSIEYNRNEAIYLRGEGFGSDQFQYPGNAGKVTEYDGRAGANNLLSVFGRANYSLLSRYLLTASLRTDGSSRFGEGQRFGVFPAASIGWTISDEPMLASSLGRLMSLKFRASYGETGNQAIPTNFGFLTSFARANYAGEPGLAQNALGNPDLRWETTKEQNFGADVGFLNGRISLIADYYIKKTSDLLVQRPISTTSGFGSIWDNVGSVENKGVDLQITTQNLVSNAPNGLSWETSFNASRNRNRVTSLYRGEPFNSGIRSVNRIEIGYPIGSFYSLDYTGLDAEGNAKYRDVNGDGDITSADRTIVGSPHPDWFGGLRNELRWRGLDFTTFFEFSRGKEIFNLFRLFSDDAGYYFGDNKIKSAGNYWKQPGDEKDPSVGPRPSYYGASNAYDVSSRFVEDGSYVRFQELTVGYRLPSRLMGATGLTDTRLYVSGRNLHLWTDYEGYDPDVNSHGSDANTSLGVEFYAYPRARVWSIGLTTNW